MKDDESRYCVLHQTEHPYLLRKGCRKGPCWDFRHKHGVWQCSRPGNFWKYSGETVLGSSFLCGRTSIPSWALSFSLLWVLGVSHLRGGSEVPRQKRRSRGHARVCIWRRYCQPGLWLQLWNGIIPMLTSIRPCHRALFVMGTLMQNELDAEAEEMTFNAQLWVLQWEHSLAMTQWLTV